MAYKLNASGLQELQTQMEQMGMNTPGAMKRAVYAGAKEVADAVRRSVQGAASEPTGVLAQSLAISKLKADGRTVSTTIGFSDYDPAHKSDKFPKGVPNSLKAAVLESGRSDQPGRKKTHFFSRAMSASRDAALQSMENEFLSSLTKDLGE